MPRLSAEGPGLGAHTLPVRDARQRMFLEGPIGAALWRLSLPIIIGNLLQTGYQLTDAFWVGRLGADAVAAVAVSFPLTFLVIALGSGLAMAGATLSAQYTGAGRPDRVNHVAAQTMMMVMLGSIVLGGFGYVTAPALLHALRVTPTVYTGALGFMRMSFLGVPFVFGYLMFQALMRGIGQVKLPVVITLLTVLLNFALDPLFMFGHLHLQPRGVMGAALATFFTQALAAAIGLAIFLRGRHGIQLALRDFRPDPPYIRHAFKLGLPGSIEMSTRALGLMVMSFLVAGFGTLTIATYGVGSSVLQVIFIPAMGLAIGASTLVGQNMGAGNVDRAGRVAILAAVWAFCILSVIGVAAWFTAPWIVSFFVPGDPRVIAAASHYLRIMCLSWGGIGVQLCISSAFRACGKMVDAMVIALVAQWLVQFPLAYALAQHTRMGAEGVWWSVPIVNVIVPVVACLWFARGTWRTGRLTKDDVQMADATQGAIGDEALMPVAEA